jgi:hypothetical protein
LQTSSETVILQALIAVAKRRIVANIIVANIVEAYSNEIERPRSGSRDRKAADRGKGKCVFALVDLKV